ncbi:ribosome biogenesis GTPase [[Clostridium] celerecrescens 18A]|uniref:Ribosome biogenesis GTPase n=2 Tax=Lacrimispora celerecrescens TaxID=29354 RepID=A0A2M8Z1C9_9FIRM|nr:RNHCP domain-containing protein [Lacrimispora celerecrescens]PJJ27251.1 ribosome biogenesis GTPase [[Clostridium] celerecrescens 18A]
MNKKKGIKIKKDINTEAFQATVINIMNKQVKVLSKGEVYSCLLPGSLISNKNSLVVGDEVEAENAGNGQYKLIHVLPRKTALYRGNRRSPEEKVLVAANVQCLLAFVTADYLLHQAGYLESAIIAARRAQIQVGIFISKWDLIGESAQALLEAKLELYKNTADFVFAGSARERQEELFKTVEGKTVVVVGDRSCGKTTLIHGSDSRCPMTSTHTSVLEVGLKGTFWIDTPGFRDFALQQISEEERNAVFPELAQLTGGCYFRNCTHVHEDGCQVLEALRSKKLKRERYDAYQKMTDIKAASSFTPKIDYRHSACTESFTCKVCGTLVVPEGAGSRHRNHCPKCLSSIHIDNDPGDRASLCKGIMEPVSVWVRKGGEWAIIHRCRMCGALSSNRIAADDNPAMLMSIAVKPLAMTPFPLNHLEELFGQ